jgi:FkbM family methyltransferase
MSLAQVAPEAAPDLANEKIYQLIRRDWNVVVAAARNDAWVQACVQFCPTAHYFVFADDAASQLALSASLRPLGGAVVVEPRPLGRAGTEGVETLDAQRAGRFHHLNYLRIERAEAAMDVLMGARSLLRYSRINLIEIAPAAAGTDSLAPLIMVLERYNYIVMRLEGDAFRPLTHADIAASRWGGHTIAVHSRLLSSFTQTDAEILELPELLANFGIKVRGVIQVGAHYGEELPTYLEMGARPILLIEANPILAQHLGSIAATTPGVAAVHCAVTDEEGPVELHIASADQASSILPFKVHQRVYPDIVETAVVAVDGMRLDRVMETHALDHTAFNLLCIDIQGAELRALRGATHTLQSIDAINIEINFEEMYAGCAQVEDIDDFLDAQGFDRVATLTPYHSFWGDALYVRRNFALNAARQ